ncbi:hypothetical protein LTR91_011886 [Friedmanniomyces endolithicus]|uniref:Uncharacterized protein n=1 Tax=Friedmanniomyces endolithicus TaxID=329885 RepID=A0AAN6QR99_9PEZI|nr:hypothetical protein LTR57_020452 [Friedmanniomyces endolithicus]KAK0979993.1 hypothetical protein LTS01_012176 [Friedmanniomyces endolithicus]KAK0981579.1 hypothetical protein LTR91_011886 [Friedmanniomyces endolithicus]KAK1036271.1 hypothetical protein LTS16_013833 [Friedmanniomyces endolithicus]
METEARTEAYNAMHTITMRHYREDRLDEAFELAGKLLLDAELPRLLSARCHMVLSTDDENVYFLQHAEEAVRILNVDCREGLEDPANFPQKQYDEALRLLKEAKDSKTEDDVAKAAGTYGAPNRGEGGVEGEAKEEAKEEGGGRISAADKQAINEAMALYPDMKMDASSA